MVNLEYFNGEKWTLVGCSYPNERVAWLTLGPDNVNYRTVDSKTKKVLTDRSE